EHLRDLHLILRTLVAAQVELPLVVTRDPEGVRAGLRRLNKPADALPVIIAKTIRRFEIRNDCGRDRIIRKIYVREQALDAEAGNVRINLPNQPVLGLEGRRKKQRSGTERAYDYYFADKGVHWVETIPTPLAMTRCEFTSLSQ